MILQGYVWYGIHLSVVSLVWQQFFLLMDHLWGSWPHARAELTYSENSVSFCFYAVDNVLFTDNYNHYLEGIWSHLSKIAWLHLSDILLCVSCDCRWSYNLTTCIRSWLWYDEVPNLDTWIFSDTFTYLITTHKFLKHWLDMTNVLSKAMNCEMMLMKLILDIFACHTAPR